MCMSSMYVAVMAAISKDVVLLFGVIWYFQSSLVGSTTTLSMTGKYCSSYKNKSM